MSDFDNHTVIDPLTEREFEVLELMSEGYTNRDIAKKLVISFETVRWYTKQIYGKLGVHSRAQAIIHAREMNLFKSSEDKDVANIEPSPLSPKPPIRHNLPDYALSFVGRKEELSELRELLTKPDIRLITVAGLGGIGKTRLCIEVARQVLEEFKDGIYFVPLNAVTSVEDILPAIVQVMGLRFPTPVNERLIQYFQNKHILLILDSFEHLVENVSTIQNLLRNTNHLKLMLTSQTSLNLREEWVRYIEGISTHDNLDDAIRLFVERAERVRGDFSLEDEREHVLKICRLVDGMPLAIELATTWLKTLSCADIAREIHHNIDFLTTRERDVDERHRSIRAIYDYSWELLNEEEQRVFRRLSVFRGGFGYATAQQVAGATPKLLADLIDKSLLIQNSNGTYEIHDLLRKYTEQRLITTKPIDHSTRSSMIAAWSSLVRGEFITVHNLVNDIMSDNKRTITGLEEAFGLALQGTLAGIEGDYPRGQQLCEASINLIPVEKNNQRDPVTAVFATLGMAISACGQQDYYLAKRYVLISLNIAQTLNAPAFKTLCLPVIAVLFAHEVEFERAIELIALAFTHPASTPEWMEQWSLLQQLVTDLKLEVEESQFEAAWNKGQSQNLELLINDLITELASIA